MSTTDLLRRVFAVLLALVVIAAVVGWYLGLDPAALSPVMVWATTAVATGEASAVGKRATYRAEADKR